MAAVNFVELPLGEFLDAVAAKAPVPGGGTASCVAAALGASLGTMAARFAKHESGVAAAEKLGELSRRLLALGARDTEAYEGVLGAAGLPKGTDAQKASRKSAMQAALAGAAEVPLEAMGCAHEALRVLADFAPHGNRNLASDLGSGAHLLLAGLEGCALNVAINLAALEDPQRKARLRERASHIRDEARERHRRILEALGLGLAPA